MKSNPINLVNNKKDANAITHSGSFHADDIFSTIFLSKIQPINLYRTNEIKNTEDIKNKIIFDIGYGKFDHHGENARVRDNEIKYSAFGLLFETFGIEYLKQKQVEEPEIAYQMFLKEFVFQIDAIDNGIFPSHPKEYTITTLSSIIEMFNKTWKEAKDSDEAFLEAIQVGMLIFDRIEKRILDKLASKKCVEKQIEASENCILILPEYMPFINHILGSKNKKAEGLLFAIFPSNRGGYNIRAIASSSNSYENRLDFPKEWGGKTKEELESLTGIKSFRFCHPNLFLCACDNLNDAIKVAKLAIKQK